VPPEQGVGLDEEAMTLHSREHLAETSEQGSVSRLKSRTVDLSSEDCNLVSEHEYLYSQISCIAALETEELQGADEGEIEEGESHGPFSPSPLTLKKLQVSVPDDILGTHTLRRSHRMDHRLTEVARTLHLATR
jgi:hypothetical protein